MTKINKYSTQIFIYLYDNRGIGLLKLYTNIKDISVEFLVASKNE